MSDLLPTASELKQDRAAWFMRVLTKAILESPLRDSWDIEVGYVDGGTIQRIEAEVNSAGYHIESMYRRVFRVSIPLDEP